MKDEIKHIQCYITNLQEENQRLKEWKKDLLKENIELENTRKKAIQFIKENDGYAISRNYYDNKLLNILEGR